VQVEGGLLAPLAVTVQLLTINRVNVRPGLDATAGSACWCRRWLQFLQSVPAANGTLAWLTKLDEDDVVRRATDAWQRQAMTPSPPKTPQQPQSSPVQQQPASTAAPTPPPSCPTNKFAYYLSTIRGDCPLAEPAPHLSEVPDPSHRISLSRFRCSCHALRIEQERYLPPALRAPAHMRTCLQCASSAIEDETHMVFHCPIYDHLRFEFADLFPTQLPPSLPCFLSQDQTRVAAFIHSCLILRRRNACMSLAGSETAM
jgi:hypothetical protein